MPATRKPSIKPRPQCPEKTRRTLPPINGTVALPMGPPGGRVLREDNGNVKPPHVRILDNNGNRIVPARLTATVTDAKYRNSRERWRTTVGLADRRAPMRQLKTVDPSEIARPPPEGQDLSPVPSPKREPPTAETDNRSDDFFDEPDDPDVAETSIYGRAMQQLHSDIKWQREIALKKRIQFYYFHRNLGSGNFSQVKMAVHELTKHNVAVKIVERLRMDTKCLRMLDREVRNLQLLHHPNIIRLYEVVETSNRIYLITEYADGGDLFIRITEGGRLDNPLAKQVMSQLVAAVDHLHSMSVVHRDIKAENAFITSRGQVKLGDFGFSRNILSKEELLATYCGSPPYAAPELFSEETYIGPSVDVWALGVLLYFCVCGHLPFNGVNITKLKESILQGTYSVPNHVDVNCSMLLERILCADVSKRATIREMMESSWLKGSDFPMPLEKYNLVPSVELAELTETEIAARQQLHLLGITDKLIKENIPLGAYSSITGTYRIVLHSIQQMREREEQMLLSDGSFSEHVQYRLKLPNRMDSEDHEDDKLPYHIRNLRNKTLNLRKDIEQDTTATVGLTAAAAPLPADDNCDRPKKGTASATLRRLRQNNPTTKVCTIL